MMQPNGALSAGLIMRPEEQPTQTFPRTDHDLLIEVSTNVKNLTSTIHSYNTASLTVTKDHEDRIRDLEKNKDTQSGSIKTLKWVISIAITLLGTAIAFVAAMHS